MHVYIDMLDIAWATRDLKLPILAKNLKIFHFETLKKPIPGYLQDCIVKYILSAICLLVCHTIFSITAAITQLHLMSHAPQPFYPFYLPPAGDINLHHVCACVRACVGACVRACVTQVSQRLLQLDIFCQRRVLMNFHALEYFFGFIHFELKLSE